MSQDSQAAEGAPTPQKSAVKSPPKSFAENLGYAIGKGLGFAALVYVISLFSGPVDILWRWTGLSEAELAHWATPLNIGLAALFGSLSCFGPKAWRILASALAGAVFGLHVGHGLAEGFGDSQFAFEFDAAMAFVVGAVFLLLGLIILLGLVNKKAAERMELESTGPDRAMMMPSAITTIAEGALLIALAVISVLKVGSFEFGLAIAAALLAMAVSAWGNWQAWRKSDELMRQVWSQGVQVAVNLTLFFGALWFIGQTVGVLPEASLLGMLAAFWAIYLASSITLMALAYPWMLQKSSAQADAEAA